MITPDVSRLIDLTLSEDLVGGDPTTDGIFGPDARCVGVVLAKTDLVLAGSEVFDAVMQRVDPAVEVSWRVRDGARVANRTVLADLAGPARAILKGERNALNFLQRMSGVATATRSYVEALAGTDTQVTDTRKTLPGWRSLDKLAVRVGGGRNHRTNLGAGVMIKDNHIAAAGSITDAVERVRARAPHTLKIEVEIDVIAQLHEALDAGADIILLDNMSTAEMRRAVAQVRAHPRGQWVLVEASGGVVLDRVAEIAETGVDFISVGALTHSVIAADISLDLDASAP